jgi:uncharacterized membrane protein YoaK (UPF0700 family)
LRARRNRQGERPVAEQWFVSATSLVRSALKSQDTMLALVAGYVDTLGFVALFGLFTAHVTGNFVLIGAELLGAGQGVLMKLLAFPAFMLGIVLSNVVARSTRSGPGGTVARSLFLLQGLFLVTFLIAGLYAMPIRNADAPGALLCGILGTIAMGIQNAHGKLVRHGAVPNTVMTGNVTQVVLDALDLLIPRLDSSVERSLVRQRFLATLTTILSFGAGAVAGALGFRFASFWAILLPIGLIVLLAARGGGDA